jgi:hypothetical protein
MAYHHTDVVVNARSSTRSGFQKPEVRGQLAQIGVQADLASVVVDVAMAADEDRDCAGRPGQPRDRPGGRPPGLAGVKPDVAGALGRAQVGEQGEGRDAVGPQQRDLLAYARMIDRDDGERIGLPAKLRSRSTTAGASSSPTYSIKAELPLASAITAWSISAAS